MIKLNWKFDTKFSKFLHNYICTSTNQPNLKAHVTFEYIPTKGGKSKKQCAFDVLLLDDDGYGLGANRFETKKEVTAFLKEFFADPKSTLKKHWNSQNEEGLSSAILALDYIASPKCKPELFAEVIEELEAEKKENKMKLAYAYNSPKTWDKLIVDQIIVVTNKNGSQSHNHNHASLVVHKEGHITKAGNYSRRTIEIDITICNPEGCKIAYRRVHSHRKAMNFIKENLLLNN